MGSPLEAVTIHGFKSIHQLEDFSLGNLNVLVGANGAGKSNFVSFFRMLRAMAEGGLTSHITKMGGADGFFFGGPKTTPSIDAHLRFGLNQYFFVLQPTAANEMMVLDEKTFFNLRGHWRSHGGGKLESQLKTWENRSSNYSEGRPSVEAYVYQAVSSWIVYHFHDTSMLSPCGESSQYMIFENSIQMLPILGHF